LGKQAAILRRTLAGRPTFLLRVPVELGAEAAADAIAEAVDAVLPDVCRDRA
jgi:hypothetical protein